MEKDVCVIFMLWTCFKERKKKKNYRGGRSPWQYIYWPTIRYKWGTATWIFKAFPLSSCLEMYRIKCSAQRKHWFNRRPYVFMKGNMWLKQDCNHILFAVLFFFIVIVILLKGTLVYIFEAPRGFISLPRPSKSCKFYIQTSPRDFFFDIVPVSLKCWLKSISSDHQTLH